MILSRFCYVYFCSESVQKSTSKIRTNSHTLCMCLLMQQIYSQDEQKLPENLCVVVVLFVPLSHCSNTGFTLLTFRFVTSTFLTYTVEIHAQSADKAPIVVLHCNGRRWPRCDRGDVSEFGSGSTGTASYFTHRLDFHTKLPLQPRRCKVKSKCNHIPLNLSARIRCKIHLCFLFWAQTLEHNEIIGYLDKEAKSSLSTKIKN